MFKRLVGLKRQMATVQLHGDYVQLLHAVSQINSCDRLDNGHGGLAIARLRAKLRCMLIKLMPVLAGKEELDSDPLYCP